MGQRGTKQEREANREVVDAHHQLAMDAVRPAGNDTAIVGIQQGAFAAASRSLQRGGAPFIKDELIVLNKIVNPTADASALTTMTVDDLRKLLRSNIVLRSVVTQNSETRALRA